MANRTSRSDTETTLTNEELCDAVEQWVFRLAESGGRDWELRIPLDVNRDPDLLIVELVRRFKKAADIA